MGYPAMNTSYAQTKYNVTWCNNRKSNGTMKYIVIHYTATDASAKNNVIYFSTGNRNASADYFIDKDGSIYKFNANTDNYFSWQCGDGYGQYGITNANSIGIEVVSSGAEYTSAQKDALRALVLAIMEDYGVPASRVVRHYDASRKICPRPYCGSSAKDAKWDKLHAQITGGNVNGSSTPAPSAPAASGKIDEDGLWGEQTTLALQKALNAPYKDGIISRQQASQKKYLAACVSGWEFGSGYAQGSQTIELLQKKIGADVDGVAGPNTVKALQKYLGTYVDGYLDNPSPCVKEMQRRLNAGTF